MKKLVVVVVLTAFLGITAFFQLQQPTQAKGPPLKVKIIGFYQVAMERIDIGPNASLSVTLSCDPGDQVVGGGFALGSSEMAVIRNEPDNNLINWELQVRNDGVAASWFRARANCVDVTG